MFRKLRPLAYLSSYSHRGKYYTLNEIARFDQFGLWSHHQVRFSRHRTLINTCAVLVADSEAGYSADELEHLLHVQVRSRIHCASWLLPSASTAVPSALSGGSCPTSCAISRLLPARRTRTPSLLHLNRSGHGGDRRIAELRSRRWHWQGRIRRSKVGLRWVHFSADSKHYHAQLRARHIAESASTAPSVSSVGRVVPDELRACCSPG